MFYDLFTDEGRRKKFAYGIIMGEYPAEYVKCAVCGREWDRELLLSESIPLSVVLSNEHCPDFMGIIYHDVMSEKAKQVLQQEAVTGYHLGDLTVIPSDDLSIETKKDLSRRGYKVKKFATNPPPYHRLFIDGKAALHDQSGVYLKEACHACGYEKYHIPRYAMPDPDIPVTEPTPAESIRHSSWDGSDLFRVQAFPGAIYCTQRFYDIYHDYKLTGLLFDKVESL